MADLRVKFLGVEFKNPVIMISTIIDELVINPNIGINMELVPPYLVN